MLFRVPDPIKRNDEELVQLLAAWPRDLPLTMEFQHDLWRADEVHLERLRAVGAALCITELPAADAP